MITVPDSPLDPERPDLLLHDPAHVARCAYLAAVQGAQQRCEQLITAARTEYVQAEYAAWTIYQEASPDAVRAWFTETGPAESRWFTPAHNSRPYTEPET